MVHYTMGGIRVDDAMRVVRARDDGGVEPVDGLFAVWEMTGWTHGRNRLGGNALTECAVFGRAAGRAAMIVRDGETTTTTTTAAAAAAARRTLERSSVGDGGGWTARGTTCSATRTS